MKFSLTYICVAIITYCIVETSFANGRSKSAPLAGTVGITGSTTICSKGDSALLTITISGPDLAPPFDIAVSGPEDYVFNDTTATMLEFYVKSKGFYEIVTAKDAEGDLTPSPSTATINYYNPVNAITSGSTEICPGDSTEIPVVVNGDFPVSLIYTINGNDTTTLDGIISTNYSFDANQPGIYKLYKVIDTHGCEFELTSQNTYTINPLSEPSALIVGNATICRNSSVPVSVLLEGESPWRFSYSRDGTVLDTLENINQSPYSFNVDKDGTYQIENVWDNNCIGEGTGSATIDYYPETNVNIIGLSSTYSLNSPAVELTGVPSGGVFTGPGVVTSSSKFYPELAGVEGSPHEIVYAYTNPDNNCTSYDTALVSVIDSVASIFIIDEKPIYCFNDPPFTVIGSNIDDIVGSFSIEGGKGLNDNFDNTATVDPSVLKNGTFTITYSFFDGEDFFNIEKDITVEFIEKLFFIGFDDQAICKNDEAIELEGNNPNGIFTGSGVTGNIVDGFIFNPSLAKAGRDSVFYSFTSINGCTRDTFESTVVYDIPKISFTVTDSCISEIDPTPIKFINNTESENTVVQWNWNFNDNTSGPDNFSTLKNPTHLYKTSGPRNVSLSATTDKGCSASRTVNIPFGDKPSADFTFETECFVTDSAIKFTDASVSKTAIAQYKWKFMDNGRSTISFEQNPEYVFSSLSDYEVELVTITEFGCTDTLKKEIFLRPTFDLADGPHFQDFEIGPQSWVAENHPDNPVNNWEFGNLTGNIFDDPSPTNTSWYTNLEERETEQSWISSPCFNFVGTEKPFIKLEIWRAFEQNRDGTVLQATTDNGLTWMNIGSIEDGINWYNSFTIQGQPGNQGIGWTNKIDNRWVEARHRLDSLAGKKNVQFRLAYGSDGTGINNEGFAFDDIWITERDRKVLIEHFTNVGDSLHNATNEIVRELNMRNPKDMIEIQYHLPGPGIDSFHLANPVGPNTRIIQYGLSGGPISVLNGRSTFTYQDDNDMPVHTDVIVNSLTDAAFDVHVNTSINGNIMNIETETKALKDFGNQELTLMLAVVQDISYHLVDGEQVTFYNVFRDFVPDPAGITYLGSWIQDDVRFEELQYVIGDDVDSDNLSVIAFLQNENTSEILQVETDQDSLATGIRNYYRDHIDFVIYPNPASKRAYVNFDKLSADNLRVQLIDYTGKIVIDKPVPKYSVNGFSFSTSGLPVGMYIVRVIADNRIGMHKLIISKHP